MKLRLFTTYFESASEERSAELKKCVEINSSKIFDEIHLLQESPITNFPYPKVIPHLIPSRPTYSDFLEIINRVAYPEDISIISNGDIFFINPMLEAVKSIFSTPSSQRLMLACSRWDIFTIDYSTGQFADKSFARVDSQDVWIIKGKPLTTRAPFELGIPGCENTFAATADAAGYKLFNPSLDLKFYHLHISNVRTYTLSNGDVIKRYPPPYRLVEPCYVHQIKL